MKIGFQKKTMKNKIEKMVEKAFRSLIDLVEVLPAVLEMKPDRIV